MARSYSQHCALAHALDIVGERWTLLIVRELMAGPQRYTELGEGLVTVPSNVLAGRLKEMESRSLVRRRQLPAPAASVTVYELTEEGESLIPVVIELARWGLRTLSLTVRGQPFRARWLVLALEARFDAATAVGLSECYEFDIDGDGVVSFEIADGDGKARMGPAVDPVVRIVADADTFAALTSGAITAAQALRQGARIEGSAKALERMRSILPDRRAEDAGDTLAVLRRPRP
jgi:DNA-binding HxlR family transcriptional regulator